MVHGELRELRSRRPSGMTSEVAEFSGLLPGPTRLGYEAGATGYGLARAVGKPGVGTVAARPRKKAVSGRR
jgi:hypothetical protein